MLCSHAIPNILWGEPLDEHPGPPTKSAKGDRHYADESVKRRPNQPTRSSLVCLLSAVKPMVRIGHVGDLELGI